ncbi:MAG: glycosyltransferase family 2 protein [Pseudomonadota bacterium]
MTSPEEAVRNLRILTLATCHNRRASTLSALADLYAQELPDGVSVAHVIVDDGSSDGTGAAVREAYPDVTVVEGDGNLYWAGGMRHGWEQYARQQPFDYLFVYNDDSLFTPDALSCLLAAVPDKREPAVVVGSFQHMDGTGTTYGARRRSSRWHPFKFGKIVEPNGTVQQAEVLNMNGALISRGALERVGFLSDYFVHSGADFEYGLKLRKVGGQVLVAPKHIGRCAMNPASTVTPQDAPSLRAATKMLFDKKREPFSQRLRLYHAHGGWLWPLFWVTPYISIWLYPFRGRHRQREVQ